MTTITHNGVTIEAETFTDAKKQLAKMEREAKKAQIAKDIASDIALSAAQSIVGRLCLTAWDGCSHNGELSRGYCRHDITDKYNAIQETSDGYGSRTYTFSLANGIGSLTFYNVRVSDYLTDGAGWPLALRLVETLGVEQASWVTVAQHNGETRFSRIPTILYDVIEKTRKPAQS